MASKPSGRTLSAPSKASSNLRIFDPRLTGGLRDDAMLKLRCLAARGQRHHRGQLLTARAAGRIFCGGDGTSSAVDGRINAWSTSTGAMLCAANLDSSVMCLAVVETVRPAQPLRAAGPNRAGAADGFGCELIVWAGLSDGKVAVLGGGDLALRITLGGHRGSIATICSPGAPPSAPTAGAAVVLSGGEDGAMRMWDARTAECLRSIPGGGAALRAMLPVWLPDGDNRRERCKVWSADAEQTLCVWEPRRAPAPKEVPLPSRGGPKAAAAAAAAERAMVEAPAPTTVTLNADVTELSVSTDGTVSSRPS